jgi:signal transduction histidine kinase/ligand-binding sensor domain-containing protein
VSVSRENRLREVRALLGALLTLLLALHTSVLSQAGNIKFRQYSLEDGLSQSTVTAILEDRQGFYWFGTQDGLNKFDGYSFTVFRHKLNDSSTISDNWISCLLEDRNGYIWVGTYNYGVNRLDPATDSSISYLASPLAGNRISSNNITSMVQDSSGRIWISTWGGGLNRLDPSDGTFTSFKHDDADTTSIASDKVRCLSLDRHGNLWVGTWNGLDRLKRGTEEFLHYRHRPQDESSIAGDRITGLIEDRSGNLWCSTEDNGLSILDVTLGQCIQLNRHSAGGAVDHQSEFLGLLAEGDDGDIWIATYGSGVRRYRGYSGGYTEYRHDMSDPQSLGSDHVFMVFCDRSGRIWVGTDGGGVSRYDRRSNKFAHYRSEEGKSSTLSHNNIRSMTVSRDGTLWIGTLGGGVDGFTPPEGVVSSIRRDPRSAAGLSSDNVFSVVEDLEGYLWIGTEGAGLNRYDRRTGKAKRYVTDRNDSTSLSHNTIMALHEDRRGRLWIGTYGGGLNMYEKTTDRFRRIIPYPLDKNGPHGNYIWAIHEDENGKLWLGTWGAGLNCYDPDSMTNISYREEKNPSAGLSHNTIWSIHEDANHDLWIGTAGGLDHFVREKKTFVHYTEADGLPNDVVYGILPDRKGNLWLSTVKGLGKFNPWTTRFENYDVNDGLQSNEFNQGAFCALPDGRLCFGGVNGFNMFDPDSILGDTVVPNIVISGFKVFDRPVRLKPDADGVPTVRISYSESFFSFDFVVLDVTAPARNRYAYMLVGFDPDWIQCGTRRYAGYTNLDGGEYLFRVKGCNSDGVWNEKGASVRILISPPYWNTWWFRLAVIMLLLGFVAEMFRRNILRLSREKRSQEHFSKRLIDFQERERKRIAGELHDSLGQNLLVMKNALSLCQEYAAPNAAMSAHLEQLSELTLQSLNEVREISFDLHPHTLERLGLRKGIQSVVTKIGQTSNIGFSTDIDAVDARVSKDKEIHIFRIIQEGLNNVVKHSGATTCTLTVRVAADAIIVTIHDDGKGFVKEEVPEEVTHQGFGLKGMAERTKLVGGELSIESAPSAGTTVRVTIPIERLT